MDPYITLTWAIQQQAEAGIENPKLLHLYISCPHSHTSCTSYLHFIFETLHEHKPHTTPAIVPSIWIKSISSSINKTLLEWKYKNNSQSDLSDYASWISSLVEAPKQLITQITHTLQQSQLRVHASAVSIHHFEKINNDHYSTLKSSNDQLQHNSSKNPCMTWVPRIFYGKVACNKQKQVYIFIENNTLVPLENSNYVIWNEPTKHHFRYNHQTLQLNQAKYNKCKWSMRNLLCQDIILHQMMGTNIRQTQTPDCVNRTGRWGIHIPIATSKDTEHNIDTRQNDRLWKSVPDNYVETSKRQDFNNCKLVQEQCLKSLTVTDKLERMYPPYRSNSQKGRQNGHYSQTQRDIKIDRMSKLLVKWSIWKGKCRKLELAKLQQDPTQIPVISREGTRLRKIIS